MVESQKNLTNTHIIKYITKMNLIKIKRASNWLKITCSCDINNISKYKEIECMDKLIKWAMEIQSLAQNGNLGFAGWMVRCIRECEVEYYKRG